MSVLDNEILKLMAEVNISTPQKQRLTPKQRDKRIVDAKADALQQKVAQQCSSVAEQLIVIANEAGVDIRICATLLGANITTITRVQPSHFLPKLSTRYVERETGLIFGHPDDVLAKTGKCFKLKELKDQGIIQTFYSYMKKVKK